MKIPDLVILSTQRSGSTMVCDDIALIQKLGVPSEHYTDLINKNYLGCDDRKLLQVEFDNIINISKTSNGFSSVKIMANQIQPIGRILNLISEQPNRSLEDAFIDAFQHTYFVRVFRDNKFAQAVSRYLAIKTGVFHLINNDSNFKIISPNFILNSKRDESSIHYNFNEIFLHWSAIVKEEFYLNTLIDEYNLKVFDIKYEDIINDRSYIYQICASLNTHALDFEVGERRLMKIGSDTSLNFIELFTNDFHRLKINEVNI